MPQLDNNKNENSSNSSENENSYRAVKNDQKNKEDESSKKAAGVAGKAALNYFTAGKGGQIYDKAKKIPGVGKKLDKAEEKLGKTANRLTGGKFGKTAKKLDDAGALDAADKAMSLGAGGQNGSSAGANSLNEMGNSAANSSDKNKSSGGMLPGGGGKKSKSSTNSIDDSSDSSENEQEVDMSGTVGGTGFLKNPKTKIIVIAVSIIFFFILGLLMAVVAIDEQQEEEKEEEENACGVIGSCLYTVPGFRNESKIYKQNMDISNLKVRLMNENGTAPVPNEPLVDFEKYILGTTYQEHVGEEADTKAQAIAARSYALSRPSVMGNSNGTKLSKENGQWILQLRNSVNDQTYCDPDRGYPSTKCGAKKPKLPQNSKVRQWVAETAGQVVVDNNGYIVNTDYAQSVQIKWNSMAKSGLDYNQILLQHYRSSGAAKIVSMNCTGSGNNNCNQATGDYAKWLQSGQSWSGIYLGTSSHTIGKSGCLATSIAMLIAKAGVSTNVEGEFNPGTFVKAMNKINGFSGANLLWNKVSEIAPSFVYGENISVANYSKSDKLSKIGELVNNGYAVVAEVKGNTGQHWVAIDTVNGKDVIMMDPASDSSNMWQQYNWKNTSRLVYYKINK